MAGKSGDGAFYGPKIDIKVEDSLKRQHQCGTIQLDFNLPERFKLTYASKEDISETPVMIHRAIFGSLERFIAILLEHTRGDLPFWLSPRKIRIITVNDQVMDYAKTVKETFSKYEVDIDMSDDKIGKKIRNAEVLKYNYIFVLGKKEEESKSINVRMRDKIFGMKSMEEVVAMCEEEYSKQFLF